MEEMLTCFSITYMWWVGVVFVNCDQMLVDLCLFLWRHGFMAHDFSLSATISAGPLLFLLYPSTSPSGEQHAGWAGSSGVPIKAGRQERDESIKL